MIVSTSLASLSELARELGVAHTEGSALQIPASHAASVFVQSTEDGALVIHAPGAPLPDEETMPYALIQALALNTPRDDRASVHALHADDPDHWLVFDRLPRADLRSVPVLADWVKRFLAHLEGKSIEPTLPADVPIHLDGHWRGLCDALGLESSDTDGMQTQPVVPDDGLPVTLALDAETGDIELRATVSVLPTELDDDGPCWRRLLQAHALGADTAGAVFAIDEAAQELVVWLRVPAGAITASELASLIDHVSSLAARFTP